MRIAAMLLITLGLAAQGPWGATFCADCGGGVSSESADDGVCLGSVAGACGHGDPCDVDSSTGASIDIRSEHVGCGEALRGGDTAPPPDSSSFKRLVSRSGSDPAVASERLSDPASPRSDSGTVIRLSHGAPSPASSGSVVLLL